MKKIEKTEFVNHCGNLLSKLNLKSTDNETIDFKDENGIDWHIFKSVVSPNTPSLKELEIHVTCRYTSQTGKKGLLRCRWYRHAYIYDKVYTNQGDDLLDNWSIQVYI